MTNSVHKMNLEEGKIEEMSLQSFHKNCQRRRRRVFCSSVP